MTRWLVQFGYDGRPFAGWARQPGQRTVEGEILGGLVRCGVAHSEAAAGLRVASRTDRGVSARGNALVVELRRSGGALLGALNAIAREIFFTRASEVPETFRVRAAVSREYRYRLDPEEPGLENWERLASVFTERPIDTRSFASGLPADRPSWRTIDRIRVLPAGPGPQLQLVAGGFAWGMVRKLVQALRELSAGTLSPLRLAEAVRGERRLYLGLAPPEPLLLWSVEYDRPWEHESRGFTARQLQYFTGELAAASTRSAILTDLVELSSGRGFMARRPRGGGRPSARPSA